MILTPGQPGEQVGRVALVTGYDVRIHLERGRLRRVAEPLADDLYRHALRPGLNFTASVKGGFPRRESLPVLP